jgi:predicted nucleic acid-binding Zn ribbon protein
MPFLDCPFCDAVIDNDADTCHACGKKLNTVRRQLPKNKTRTMLNLMIWSLLGIGGLFLLGYVFGTRNDLTQQEKWEQEKSWQNNMRRIREDPTTYYH